MINKGIIILPLLTIIGPIPAVSNLSPIIILFHYLIAPILSDLGNAYFANHLSNRCPFILVMINSFPIPVFI